MAASKPTKRALVLLKEKFMKNDFFFLSNSSFTYLSKGLGR